MNGETKLNTGSYLTADWSWTMALMAAGGAVYSAGFVVYVIERPNPRPGVFGFHEVWHVLVVLAALLHYLLMYFYVLPA